MAVAFVELKAPPAWRRIDFISDLHLSAHTPRAFDAWSRYLDTTAAEAVFILGDLFEAWVGDDSRHAGFEAACADVLTSAAQKRSLAFMVGNRDFLLGAEMLRACGVTALHDPTVLAAFGERVLLSHGDELCIGDLPYQRWRAMVRQPAWQKAALTRPLDERRALARGMRDESKQHQRDQPAAEWIDVDAGAALEWMRVAGTPTLIHGHTHHPGSELLAPGFTRHVLADWDVDSATAPRAEVLRWQAGGMTRMPPELASERA